MEQGLVLPNSHNMDDDDVDYIAATVDALVSARS
jgi:dTDP-4-amino-4,6-dideoxygalactose transaminase